MQNGPQPQVEPAWDYYAEPHRRRGSGFFKAVMAALFIALVASPFLPEVVHLPLGNLKLHLPRLEFGRHGSDADSTLAGEPSTLARDLPVDAMALDQPSRMTSRPHRATTPKRTYRPARSPAPPPEEFDEPEDVQYVPDHPVTVIPQRFRTEVQLATTPVPGPVEVPKVARPTLADGSPAQLDEPRSEAAPDEDWPLLCGQVVDGSGAPVAGARVELESPRLTVTTDGRGRFCVACPAGDRTVRIDAGGRGQATRVVALKGSVFEMRIALSPTP